MLFRMAFMGEENSPWCKENIVDLVVIEPVKHVKFVGVDLTDLSLGLASTSGCRGLDYMIFEVFVFSQMCFVLAFTQLPLSLMRLGIAIPLLPSSLLF